MIFFLSTFYDIPDSQLPFRTFPLQSSFQLSESQNNRTGFRSFLQGLNCLCEYRSKTLFHQFKSVMARKKQDLSSLYQALRKDPFKSMKSQSTLSPIRDKQNHQKKPQRKLIRSMIANYKDYKIFQRRLREIESWISPKRMTSQALVQYMQRVYEMKFRSQSHLYKKQGKLNSVLQSLGQFVLKSIYSGQKQWRLRPQQFLVNLVYSIQHFRVKMIGVQIFYQFLSQRLGNDQFLFFMMSRSVIQKHQGFKIVTQGRIVDLHQRTLSHKDSVKIAKIIYQDSGIKAAQKLFQAFSIKRDQIQSVSIYALVHFMLQNFKDKFSKASSADLGSALGQGLNQLQVCIYNNLQKSIGVLIQRICQDNSDNYFKLKQRMRPYCMLAIESITSANRKAWFNVLNLTSNEAQLLLLQKLHYSYKQLSAVDWTQDQARLLSQQILTLGQWSQILSQQFTSIQINRQVQNCPTVKRSSLQQEIGSTQNQVYALIEKVLRINNSKLASKVVQDFSHFLNVLNFLRTNLDRETTDYPSHQYSSLPSSDNCNRCFIAQQQIQTIKLRLGLSPDLSYNGMLPSLQQFRLAHKQMERQSKVLLQYESVICSLKDQLDAVLEDRSRSNLSSPQSIRRQAFDSSPNQQQVQLPMFGKLRPCEQISDRIYYSPCNKQ